MIIKLNINRNKIIPCRKMMIRAIFTTENKINTININTTLIIKIMIVIQINTLKMKIMIMILILKNIKQKIKK